MLEIILTTNDGRNLTARFYVSNKKYDHLKSLERLGGFKRFDVDIFDEGIKMSSKKSEYKKLTEWLLKYVFFDGTELTKVLIEKLFIG